jgi:hypothetical protein
LLRSALQGKSYGKGVQCQNGITIIPSQSIKLEDDRTHVVYTNDPVSSKNLYVKSVNLRKVKNTCLRHL